MRRGRARWLLILPVAGLGALAIGLGLAHWQIRSIRPELPTGAGLTALRAVAGPVRVSWINTARQEMPRAAVLEPGDDPEPGLPYEMSHPSFVLEWADGRLLLVDVGMTEEGARSFGRPIEWASGGQPIRPLGSVARQLGEASSRVAGAIFTHLHKDHVEGIGELCAGERRIFVPMTESQAAQPNYTTRPGHRLLEQAGCVATERLTGSGAFAVPGFDGVWILAAAGHTPGSQVVLAQVGERRFLFAGDLVNHAAGIDHDVAKPWLYSLLVVPEDTVRLSELRQWLRELRNGHDIVVVPAHDLHEIEASGIPYWGRAEAG